MSARGLVYSRHTIYIERSETQHKNVRLRLFCTVCERVLSFARTQLRTDESSRIFAADDANFMDTRRSDMGRFKLHACAWLFQIPHDWPQL